MALNQPEKPKKPGTKKEVMKMATEVKVAMRPGDYQDLTALLQFIAGQVTAEQYRTLLASRGYNPPEFADRNPMDQQNAYIAEQILNAIG